MTINCWNQPFDIIYNVHWIKRVFKTNYAFYSKIKTFSEEHFKNGLHNECETRENSNIGWSPREIFKIWNKKVHVK